MTEEIDFDNIENIDHFNDYQAEDTKDNFVSKRKKVTKGTPEEKTFRPGLKFTASDKEEFKKFKKTFGVNTLNAVLYKFIELGKEQHLKDLDELLSKK